MPMSIEPEALLSRLRLGEDAATEFKSVARNKFRANTDSLAKEIAALANGQGGVVILGVEDDGSPSGTGDLKQTDRLMAQVTDVCRQVLSPPIHCTIRKAEVKDHTVLIVDVPARRPTEVFVVNGVTYIREANRSRPATSDELVQIFSAKGLENVGVGVPEVYRLMQEQGLPEPDLRVDAGHFKAVLRACPEDSP